MSTYVLAPPQSAETIAGFRDGQPWLVLPPTTALECRHPRYDGLAHWFEWAPWCGIDYERNPHEVRERTVPVQVPDPVLCQKCDGSGVDDWDDWFHCPRCVGSGTPVAETVVRTQRFQQRPLLVPTWQRRHQRGGQWFEWHTPSDDEGDEGCTSATESYPTERRLAGVVLHPNPVYLPVIGDDCYDMPPHPFVMVYSGDYDGELWLWHEDEGSTVLTEDFPGRPPVGALLVDMSDAVWLEGDDVVTEMWADTDPGALALDGSPEHMAWVPLSASTTLTTIEVP